MAVHKAAATPYFPLRPADNIMTMLFRRSGRTARTRPLCDDLFVGVDDATGQIVYFQNACAEASLEIPKQVRKSETRERRLCPRGAPVVCTRGAPVVCTRGVSFPLPLAPFSPSGAICLHTCAPLPAFTSIVPLSPFGYSVG